MSGPLRQIALLAFAGVLSWWCFLHGDALVARPKAHEERPLPVAVTPILEPVRSELVELAAAGLAPEPEPESAPDPELDPEPETVEPAPEIPEVAAALEELEAPEEPDEAPPPAELGTPDGEGEEATADVPLETASATPDSEQLMQNETLVEEARLEVSGEARQGFATVFVASPEDQIEIARFFDEDLVLVPRRALDPDGGDARYFRLAKSGTPRVESVEGLPPLKRYRQYRDQFAYEYARLPSALRELRRSVLSRGEVFLFAALIPPAEWAVVIGRRRSALAAAERELSEVERVVMRYLRRGGGGFDIAVEEIVFSDGSRFRPAKNP